MAKVFTITEGLENMGAMKTGGQGSVYKGRRMGEIITAIKLLPTPVFSESAADKNYTAFQNEVQKLKKVNEIPNPNVVKILSSGITESGNFPYIEMEYIEGPDLEELLKPPHEPIFTIKEVIKVADHLSHALAHCHKINVKHGDIKSNNVKYNLKTGNYVLLDFGLAIMSDEQRRTSLRRAGAIEFMAPEQNDGSMLFQTDVYSFGVVLFELLAGTVPFPLNDKSETGRNNVMIAHLEKSPPDLVTLRQQALPAGWSEQKKEQEMKVPDWLTDLIYKCLEKNPEDRFVNGVELHEYIREKTMLAATGDALVNDRITFLENENKRLRLEKEDINRQLLQYRNQANNIAGLTAATISSSNLSTQISRKKLQASSKVAVISLVVLIAFAAGIYAFVKNENSLVGNNKKPIEEYKVTAVKAYFYNQPDETTRRNAFAIPASGSIDAFNDRGGFIYTEITNEKGQTSKGWLRKQDLMTTKEWEKNQRQASSSPVNAAIQVQLQQAKQFLREQKVVEALTIYNLYSKQQVPEAMYQYARLALQNKNKNINCADAFDLMKKAASAGYAPAKRTLGFLYSFANDKVALQQNSYYERCHFSGNLSKGAQLLMEAMLAGDTSAARFLKDLNLKSR